MKRLIILFLCLYIFIVQGSAQKAVRADTIKYQLLEPYDFHLQYLKSDPAMMVDVREVFEFKGRRIKDAINIPSSGNLDFATDTIDKNCAMFFYCTTDFRSNRVAETFAEKGFKKVYSLKGGIVAWKKDGFPVIKKRERKKK